METPDLTSPDYWEGREVDIRLNPASDLKIPGLREAIEARCIESAIVLATSGSTGVPKLIVLPKAAMLASARAVNRWCGITGNDVWLGGLSTFHVGGLGIFCRASLTGSKVNRMKWHEWTRDGRAFLDAVQDSTVTSLTPVHLHDLVEAQVPCPATLRGVFIGGAALSRGLAAKADDLGWPLWPTFGMTEACSQIATALEPEAEWLPVLPHWTTRLSEAGSLMIKGPALMSGYFTADGNNGWDWHRAADHEGFYLCGDRVEIQDGKLRPLGRADHQIKILGELVSLEKLEQSLSQALGLEVVVAKKDDSRRGAELIAFIETESDISEAFACWNDALPPFERVSRYQLLPEFPRTGVGKIDRRSLEAKI
ncbi:MAG: AMP-binding protein [Verrucomicrobiales bacterium]|nr:AMP-binding protein [Verrucomicrobiales bacterium]